MNAAVVEDKAGAGKGHARFLRLELQLDDMVVPCREEPARRSEVRPRPCGGFPLRARYPGKGEPAVP